MKQYNFKRDLKRSFYLLTAFMGIFLIFLLFSLLVILPVYLFSRYYANQYSMTIVLLIIAFLLLLVIKRVIFIWKKYRKTSLLLLHLFLKLVIPLFLIVFVLVFELFATRILFHLLSFKSAIISLVLANGLLILTFLFLRRFTYKIKLYLHQKTIKQ